MTASFSFSKTRQNWPFLAFLINFVHSKCKRSSLRSQCWMRHFFCDFQTPCSSVTVEANKSKVRKTVQENVIFRQVKLFTKECEEKLKADFHLCISNFCLFCSISWFSLRFKAGLIISRSSFYFLQSLNSIAAKTTSGQHRINCPR